MSRQEKIQKVVSYIRQNFNSGDKIPPTKELMSTLEVGVNNVQDARHLLVREGFLYITRDENWTSETRVV